MSKVAFAFADAVGKREHLVRAVASIVDESFRTHPLPLRGRTRAEEVRRAEFCLERFGEFMDRQADVDRALSQLRPALKAHLDQRKIEFGVEAFYPVDERLVDLGLIKA